MGRSFYGDDDQWQDLPAWGRPHKKWAKGHAIYHEPALDRSEWVYKYLSAPNAFRSLKDRAIWFSAPSRWDDAHERWWCENLFRAGSQLATAKVYGSCWTRRWRDEPFWRMHSCECRGDDDGAAAIREPYKTLPAVRFRASTGALFDWLQEAVSRQVCKGYMGYVRYCPLDQLVEEAKRLRARDNTSLAAAVGLMMKRRAFNFEQEVRMLWMDRQPSVPGKPLPFDPIKLIDQVMIGPTKVPARQLEVAARLMKLGIPPESIELSSINLPPAV